MMREMLNSKIHKATVTQADLNYVGSITIDSELLALVDLVPGQRVLVVSNTNGERLETYVLAGESGSGIVSMNGGSALKIQRGHDVTILGFAMTSDSQHKPKKILVDSENKFKHFLDEEALLVEQQKNLS